MSETACSFDHGVIRCGPPKPSRRVCVFWVDEFAVWTWAAEALGGKKAPQFRAVADRMPPRDCQVVRCWHDQIRRSFGFMLAHESLAEVPDGERTPDFEPTYNYQREPQADAPPVSWENAKPANPLADFNAMAERAKTVGQTFAPELITPSAYAEMRSEALEMVAKLKNEEGDAAQRALAASGFKPFASFLIPPELVGEPSANYGREPQPDAIQEAKR